MTRHGVNRAPDHARAQACAPTGAALATIDVARSRAPLSRHPRFATEREMEALAYLAASRDQTATAGAIGFDLAYDDESGDESVSWRRGHVIIRRLVAYRLVTVGLGRITLTERGRVAAALTLLSRPGMMAAFFDEDLRETTP